MSSYSHCSNCGSWVVDRHVGFTMLVLLSWFCRVESWVVDRKFVGHEFLGCALWCWVAGGCCGWCDMVLGLAMKRQGWETEMRDERDMVLGCEWLLRMAWYGVGLRLLGSTTMERQRWEIGTRDERQRRESRRWETGTRDERQRRES